MRKKLYMLRHGQTRFNERHRIQGWCDAPLTERGKRQAKIAKRYFAKNGIAFDRVVCSTSERCSDTLELVTDLPYTRHHALKEMDFGEFEGQPECLMPPVELFPAYFARYGGETLEHVEARVVAKIKEVMEEEHTSVLCVTHGGVMRIFYAWLMGAEMRDEQDCDNCAVFEYDYDTDTKTFSFVQAVNHDFSGLEEEA